MRFGDVMPDRRPAAVMRMVVVVFITLLQWNVVAATSSSGAFAADSSFSSAAPHVEKCGAADDHRAPAQRRCRHIHCCILSVADSASLGRAIVHVIFLLDPRYAGESEVRFDALTQPARLISAVRVGSPRSPPAAGV